MTLATLLDESTEHWSWAVQSCEKRGPQDFCITHQWSSQSRCQHLLFPWHTSFTFSNQRGPARNCPVAPWPTSDGSRETGLLWSSRHSSRRDDVIINSFNMKICQLQWNSFYFTQVQNWNSGDANQEGSPAGLSGWLMRIRQHALAFSFVFQQIGMLPSSNPVWMQCESPGCILSYIINIQIYRFLWTIFCNIARLVKADSASSSHPLWNSTWDHPTPGFVFSFSLFKNKS